MSPFISVSLRQTDPFLFTYLMHRASLVSDGRPPVELDVTFQYSAEQAFAVVMTLHASGIEAEWSLSREQLVEGLRRHDGWGDVAMWPVARPGGEDVIRIRLGPASNHVVVEVCRAVLSAWLNETLRLIPRGSEARYLFLDQTICCILDADE
ncbi:SsgA family sporulation/cell division regulator [Streptomyces sp. NPDC001914]|uniref:SsgA family sporulation/cell division regulator n=1 Tax=Streptomyces sp. NPDC001914 TaxID=3364623 RepID=UPI0036CBF48C